LEEWAIMPDKLSRYEAIPSISDSKYFLGTTTYLPMIPVKTAREIAREKCVKVGLE
jgi:hypothetical protein